MSRWNCADFGKGDLFLEGGFAGELGDVGFDAGAFSGDEIGDGQAQAWVLDEVCAVGAGGCETAFEFVFAAGAGFKGGDVVFDAPGDGAVHADFKVGEFDIFFGAPVAAVEAVVFVEVEGAGEGFSVLVGGYKMEAFGEISGEFFEEIEV